MKDWQERNLRREQLNRMVEELPVREKEAERDFHRFVASQKKYQQLRDEIALKRRELWQEGIIQVDDWVEDDWRHAERRKYPRGFKN